MTCLQRIVDLLEAAGVPHRIHGDTSTRTADNQMEREQLPMRGVANVVVALAAGYRPAMLVLPANRDVHVGGLLRVFGWAHLRVADEDEVRSLFPDCEVGATPAVGNLYGVPVFLDEELAQEPEITFRAGSHTQGVTIPTDAYERLVRPIRGRFAVPLEPDAPE